MDNVIYVVAKNKDGKFIKVLSSPDEKIQAFVEKTGYEFIDVFENEADADSLIESPEKQRKYNSSANTAEEHHYLCKFVSHGKTTIDLSLNPRAWAVRHSNEGDGFEDMPDGAAYISRDYFKTIGEALQAKEDGYDNYESAFYRRKYNSDFVSIETLLEQELPVHYFLDLLFKYCSEDSRYAEIAKAADDSDDWDKTRKEILYKIKAEKVEARRGENSSPYFDKESEHRALARSKEHLDNWNKYSKELQAKREERLNRMGQTTTVKETEDFLLRQKALDMFIVENNFGLDTKKGKERLHEIERGLGLRQENSERKFDQRLLDFVISEYNPEKDNETVIMKLDGRLEIISKGSMSIEEWKEVAEELITKIDNFDGSKYEVQLMGKRGFTLALVDRPREFNSSTEFTPKELEYLREHNFSTGYPTSKEEWTKSQPKLTFKFFDDGLIIWKSVKGIEYPFLTEKGLVVLEEEKERRWSSNEDLD